MKICGVIRVLCTTDVSNRIVSVLLPVICIGPPQAKKITNMSLPQAKKYEPAAGEKIIKMSSKTHTQRVSELFQRLRIGQIFLGG